MSSMVESATSLEVSTFGKGPAMSSAGGGRHSCLGGDGSALEVCGELCSGWCGVLTRLLLLPTSGRIMLLLVVVPVSGLVV